MRHSSFLEINLSLLEKNFDLIQKLAPNAQILPMVKADAYGNGILPISKFLVNELGVKVLGCASLGEALHIFNEFPSSKIEVFVFSDTELQNKLAEQAYSQFKIIPVLHQKSDLDVVLKNHAYSHLPLVIKINSGMNRLGLVLEDLEEYLPVLKNRGIKHLMTHFARSSDLLKSDDKTNRQYQEFIKVQEFLKKAGVEIFETSVSNSGAIEQEFGVSQTYVRPGIMLYGPPSVLSPVIWKGHQISRWVTKVNSSFHVKKGTPVGYGVNVADKDSFMAVIPLGYGDGFLTYYSGVHLSINGVLGKVFGRINMDMTFIQFDPSACDLIRNNDLVEIWNHDHRTITDFAIQAKTHSYQVMCALTGRIPKIYKVN
jgi:alanine racemase